MKVLKIIGIVVVVLIALVFIVIQFLPSKIHMERSISVNAPAAMIYQDLIVFGNFSKWSPFPALDPEMTVSYSGPAYGTGGAMSWESGVLGNGSMTLVNANYQQGVTYEMAFEGREARPLAEVQLAEEENGTLVTWTYDEEGMTGLSRIFGLMMDAMMGPTYEDGLKNLKTRMESMPQVDYEMEVAIASPYNYISPKDTVDATFDMMEIKMGQAYGQLMSYIGKNEIDMAGPPMAVYTRVDDMDFSFIPGIPVTAESIDDDKLMIRQTPDGMAMRVSYYGPYENMMIAYEQLYGLMGWLNIESAGNPWEEYVTDPGTEPDTANWLTYIYQPIY